MHKSSACCWSTGASPFTPSLPCVFVLCCMMYFLLIFNYSKAERSPVGLSIQSRLAKPGPASWLGTQVTQLMASGTSYCQEVWDTPALAPHLLTISQPVNVIRYTFGYSDMPINQIRCYNIDSYSVYHICTSNVLSG